ncbi:MAG: fused MFS/spermidine synthase [Candidatus Omnitrophica bacterium]|nr:fused MFS/spermidine synthase [Candidatus Omnitrophota bacterium]
MKRIAYIASFLVGVNAILSQTLIIRELLVNFSGNELSTGIILCLWLIGGAIGSLIIARILLKKSKESVNLFIKSFSIVSIIIPISLFLCRIVKALFHIPVYEIIGPLQILYICAMFLTPLSLLLSTCFVICSKMLCDLSNRKNAMGIIYILEALGAAAAGAIFTFFLVGRFGSFQIIPILLIINFLFLIIVSIKLHKKSYVLIFILIISAILFSFKHLDFIQAKSQTLQWKGQRVIKYVNSPYGNITVTEAGNTLSLYENGSLFFTTQDEAFNEEFIHLVMLQHAEGENILLLGGGVGGMLKEILKHNPKKVTYLELDPSIIDVAKEFISDENKSALDDNRVEIIHEDGRFFIKRTGDKFDIIIINLPDPTTLQLNRFYSYEFYQEARSRLKKEGILATHISSKESIISDELARYNGSVYKTLKSAFDFIEYIPGESLILIASDDEEIIKRRPDILIERFDNRNLNTHFITTYHIKDKYYSYIRKFFKERLDSQYKKAQLNSDFHPICFYYDLILWGVQFHPHLVGFFNSIINITLFHCLIAILLFLVAVFLIIKGKKQPLSSIVTLAIGTSGAVAIGLEVIIILSFQVSYGYIYEKVGLLIGLFMLGLASGGYIANRFIEKIAKPLRVLSSIILLFSIYTLLVPLAIKGMGYIASSIVELLFYTMIFLAGMAVGAQFPIGVAILQKEKTAASAVSIVWGSDLLGACLGTLISSLVIIPILGIFQTAILGFLLCAGVLITILAFRQRLQL